MRTPDEIKNGLKCRICGWEEKQKGGCENCGLHNPDYGFAERYADALAYIRQLERERDAMRYDMQNAAFSLCGTCKYNNPDEEECPRHGRTEHCYVWRGL